MRALADALRELRGYDVTFKRPSSKPKQTEETTMTEKHLERIQRHADTLFWSAHAPTQAAQAEESAPPPEGPGSHLEALGRSILGPMLQIATFGGLRSSSGGEEIEAETP